MSGESGILIRDHGVNEVVILCSAVVAILTVEEAVKERLSISRRIEINNQHKSKIIKEGAMHAGIVKPRRPSGLKGETQTSLIIGSHANAADSSPKESDGHLPKGAQKRADSNNEAIVKWYGGTKPADEPNLWFTKHIDSVVPDSEIEKEANYHKSERLRPKGKRPG